MSQSAGTEKYLSMAEAMAEAHTGSLTGVVVGDFTVEVALLQKDDTPRRRRAVVRAVFAAVEGMLWQLKEDIAKALVLERSPPSTADLSLLREEGYDVGSRGEVSTRSNFIPLAKNVRFTAKALKRIRPDYAFDFGDSGWEDFISSVKVRHRLTHPKSMDSLDVTDDELRQAQATLYWFLIFVIVARRELVFDPRRPSATGASKLPE